MKPHGLISDEWLVSYAAGALPDAHALTVATHAHYHPELQQTISDAEYIGGSLMNNMEESALSDGLLEDTLSKLDVLTVAPDSTKPVSAGTDTDIPDCLRDYLGRDLDDLKWRTMGPGMKHVKLATGENGEKLWLLRARGGTEIPEHDHNGTEMTLVLRGGYHVGSDHYTPGLIEIADTDIHDHQPIIDEGEDCICLVVTDAPIRIKSLMGRMMQSFIGL